MPSQPPRFRGATPRKAWAPAPNLKATPRKRGRAGQKQRALVLARDPLCVECLKKGITRASAKADHKIPLAWGGPDTFENQQGLCDPCHDAKSAGEREIDRQARREQR